MQPEATAEPLEALDWLREGRTFDVAILDMQMPVMDGLTLGREIRKLPAPASRLPLIMFTSLGRNEVKVDMDLFAAFLTKPIKPSSLFDALIGVFTGQPTRVLHRKAVKGTEFDSQMGKHWPLRILLAEDNPVNQDVATPGKAEQEAVPEADSVHSYPDDGVCVAHPSRCIWAIENLRLGR